jgi:DTW domain-containing protein YfiP
MMTETIASAVCACRHWQERSNPENTGRWIASFLAMTASADGKRSWFTSSFPLFAKLV